MDKLQEYKLETSVDGKVWAHRATYCEGEMSRLGVPFTAEVAVHEAKEFQAFWTKKRQSTLSHLVSESDVKQFKHVRLIITI